MKAAVMGYGTIGSGVVEVLDINGSSIAKRVGEPVEIKYVLDLRDFPGDPIQDKIVHDYKTIAEDPEVKIVVETMGGVEPAYTFVKAMLEAGKHVTTSNKALVAAKGAELIALAKEKNVNFMFEASVGGGIPIIRPLNSCLTADEIEEITGIVNGTTNYMMTEMSEKGADFDEVLKDYRLNSGKENGYPSIKFTKIFGNTYEVEFIGLDLLNDDNINPLETIEIENRVEGKRKKIYTTKYERNSKNREEAIKIHGTRCMVCDFDFEEVYGELGKDFIEVHHTKPLYTLEGRDDFMI